MTAAGKRCCWRTWSGFGTNSIASIARTQSKWYFFGKDRYGERSLICRPNDVNPEEPLPSAYPNVGRGVPASCWTPERQKVKDWLAQESPSLGELYEGAVRILFELRPPGYRLFVAHAVREIGN